MNRARVMRIVSQRYEIMDEDGTTYNAIAMGKLRKDKAPMVGDFVTYEVFDNQVGIQSIFERENELVRPKIANVDQAMIVMSVKEPDLSQNLLDRLIFQISYANIKPVICFTKLDLAIDDEEVAAIIEEYKNSGYDIYTSSLDEVDENLKSAFKGKITVLTGQSGAGKSSLLNKIDPSFNIDTQAISKALGRGKHTTRHSELHEVYGGWVADTPGFSSMDFTYMDLQRFAQCVPDFKEYKDSCKFNNCIHENEPSCAVKQAVEEGKIPRVRYVNYLDVLEMIKNSKPKY